MKPLAVVKSIAKTMYTVGNYSNAICLTKTSEQEETDEGTQNMNEALCSLIYSVKSQWVAI